MHAQGTAREEADRETKGGLRALISLMGLEPLARSGVHVYEIANSDHIRRSTCILSYRPPYSRQLFGFVISKT